MAPKKKPGPKPDPNSKRSTGASRYKHPRVVFHLETGLHDRLGIYMGEAEPRPTLTSALNAAVAVFLRHHGY